MRIEKIAYVEMYVDDARKVATAYERAFGLHRVAEAGPETGLDGHHSIALAIGDTPLLLTSAEAEGPVAAYVHTHGDSVRDVAFEVDSVETTFETLVARGAEPVEPPAIREEKNEEEKNGRRRARAVVRGFGDIVHTLVEPDRSSSALPAAFRPVAAPSEAPALFTALDHVAMCLETGTLDAVTDFYERVFGFIETYKQTIETPISGMKAKVVENANGTIKFPMQEPLPGRHGPISAFIEDQRGPGVYHLGLLTDDIIHTLQELRRRDVHVLQTPRAYYEMLPARVGALDEDIEALRELNILVDRDELGYLLQVFTRSLHPRRTFFLEVIQRKRAQSFGNANVRALFDAVERETLESRRHVTDSDRM